MVIAISACRRVYAVSTSGGKEAVETAADTFKRIYQLQSPSAPASESRSRGDYYRQILWQSGCDQHCVIIAMEQMSAPYT